MAQTTKPPSKRTESELAVANCPSELTPYMVAEGVLMLADGTFVAEGYVWIIRDSNRTARAT